MDDFADGRCSDRIDLTTPYVGDRRRVLEQITQRCDRVLRPRQVFFQTVQVRGYQFIARWPVGCREHRADFGQRHIQSAKAADDLRDLYLLRRVAAISSFRVDLGGLKQASLVIVTQRFHCQVGGA